MVGTSGSADERRGVLTASATSLPSRMKGSAVAMVEQLKSTRPAMISVSISGIPRNGTCKASKPALKRNISAEMWVAEPTPAVPNVIEPGLALAAATSCCSVLMPFSGATTVTLGELPKAATAAKSSAVS